jgi:peptidoglycan hydrolase CwlO-like protein
MTKVLFLLSAVVMVVAGFFSYQNRDTFVKTRMERLEVDNKTKTDLIKLKNQAGEVVELRGKVDAVTAEVTNETERLNQAKIKFRNAGAEADNLQEQLKTAQGKIEAYKVELNNIPEGFSVETINEDINKLKQSIADGEAQVAKLQEQVAGKDAELKKVQNTVDDIKNRIEERKKSFDRNSLVATIIAVNNDWGFVVVDAGTNKGITPDTSLLITRDTQTIGKLKIVSVDGSKTVANIDQKSLRAGLTVAPGDRVILETLYR